MPYKIGDVNLVSLDYAKHNEHSYELPVNTDGYNVFNRDVFEALSMAVPHSYEITINDFHIGRVPGGHKAAFTWQDEKTGYCCTTSYHGDGIYYLLGVIEDETVVELTFDTHRMDSEDLGNKMCHEMIEAMKEEEEYSHVPNGFGGMRRVQRLPWKLTKEKLLNERFKLMQRRKRAVDHLKDASGIGVKFWEGIRERAEEVLNENKFLIGEVETLKK